MFTNPRIIPGWENQMINVLGNMGYSDKGGGCYPSWDHPKMGVDALASTWTSVPLMLSNGSVRGTAREQGN